MTALAVMGLVPSPGRVGGSVRVEGREMVGQPAAVWRKLRGERVAMVFQEPMTALNPVMTVGRQIAEVMVLHQGLSWRQAGARAVDSLADVGITSPKERAAAYPHQLSGGMRQRAMIAMALACRPALLIADEPTTALDVTIQAQILDLMLGLQDEIGMAIQFISHNLAVVSEIAHEIIVMYAGRGGGACPGRHAVRRAAAPLHGRPDRDAAGPGASGGRVAGDPRRRAQPGQQLRRLPLRRPLPPRGRQLPPRRTAAGGTGAAALGRLLQGPAVTPRDAGHRQLRWHHHPNVL